MSIVITGASGCIGRAILKHFISNFRRIYAVYFKSPDFLDFLEREKLEKFVIPVRCDIRNVNDIKRYFKGKKFEYCIYLASNINVNISIQDPAFDLETNVNGLINFLANVSIAKRIIYMSSTSVYDGLTGCVSPKSCLNPIVPYGISKLTAEHYVRFFNKKLKKIPEYVILRLSGAYGPHSPAKKIYNRIIKDFYFDKKNEITLFGNGRNLIDLLYVDEIARAIILVLKSARKDYTVDLCSGRVMFLNDLVRLSAKLFGIEKLRIKHTPFPKTEKYMTYRVSPRDAHNIFGFKNKIRYEEGLLKLAKIYRDNYKLRPWLKG